MFNKIFINILLKSAAGILIALSVFGTIGVIGDTIDSMSYLSSASYMIAYIIGMLLGIFFLFSILYSLIAVLYKINNKE